MQSKYNWINKTLENLEDDVWHPLAKDISSYLVITCNALRKKPRISIISRSKQKTMKKRLNTTLNKIILTLILFTSCAGIDNKSGASTADSLHPSVNTAVADNYSADSAALTTLVRAVYRMHETNPQNDFPLKFNNPGDSIFTGIDWEAYSNSMAIYKKTNFFSEDFFAAHRRMVLSIDSTIKQATIEWRNSNDGIPVWATDADDWCECQDNPDNYWKTITLNGFNYNNDEVTFNWSWGKSGGFEPNHYLLKARKENGTWKISYMDGYKYYGTVADYQKIMRRS